MPGARGPRRRGARATALVAPLAAALLLAGVLTGCGRAERLEPDDDEPVLTGPEPVEGARRLAGLVGTARFTDVPDRFRERLLAVDPLVTDTAGAASAYDAAIVVGLAAELARTDAPSKLATEVIDVTREGEKCYSYAGCRERTDRGAPVDYDGMSGPLFLLPDGDPGEAAFAVVRITDDGSVERLSERSAIADPNAGRGAPVANPLAGPPADGRLTIGLVLPTDGPDGAAGRAQRAGVHVAVDEMNRHGGVLGEPVVVLDGTGGTDYEATVADHLAAGVDVIVGPPTSDDTARILDVAIDAGVVVVSASATASDLGTDDRGLFFRFAPSDRLQGRTLADVVTGEGLLDVTVVAQRGEGESMIPDLFSGLRAAGGSMSTTLIFDPGAPGYGDVIASLQASPGEAWVFLGSTQALAPFLAELVDAGASPTTGRWFASNVSPQLGAAIG